MLTNTKQEVLMPLDDLSIAGSLIKFGLPVKEMGMLSAGCPMLELSEHLKAT